MEGGMGAGPIVIRACGIGGHALRRARQAMEGGDQPRFPFDRADGNGAPQTEALDLDPHHRQILELRH
jgi:hypothetical protein